MAPVGAERPSCQSSPRRHYLEASLPTQAPAPAARARLSQTNANQVRTRCLEGASRQGPASPDGRRQARQEIHALVRPAALGIKSAWRLKSEADVLRVWQQGEAWAHPLLILRARPNGLLQTRVAFVVSKKVGKAVQRNRAKRVMREVVRKLFLQITPGYDVVLIGRPPLVAASLDQVLAAFQSVLARANLLQK